MRFRGFSKTKKNASGTPAELKARSPEGKLDEVFRAITLPDTVKHETNHEVRA